MPATRSSRFARRAGWPNCKPRVVEEDFATRLRNDPQLGMRLCASQMLAHAWLGNETEVEYWKGIYAKWEAAWKRSGDHSANEKGQRPSQ